MAGPPNDPLVARLRAILGLGDAAPLHVRHARGGTDWRVALVLEEPDRAVEVDLFAPGGRAWFSGRLAGFSYRGGPGGDDPYADPATRSRLEKIKARLAELDAEGSSLLAGLPPILPLSERADGPQEPAAPGERSAKSGRRLPSFEEVERFFHVDFDYDAAEGFVPTSRVGIIYQCNQVCTFCMFGEMRTHIPPETVRRAIRAARERGSERLILTGGEPTLCKELTSYLRHARELGFRIVELQTNAVLLAKPGAAQALRDAGLDVAQVSLHGPDAEASDRHTQAPGTHRKTVEGITRLLEAGVEITLNSLFFSDTHHLLPSFMDFIRDRWAPWLDRLTVQMRGPVHDFADDDIARRTLARYSDSVPSLKRAIDRAAELGIRLHGIQDPTGVPALCVWGADERYTGPIVPLTVLSRVHEWEQDWVAEAPACASCELRGSCAGVPTHYLKLFGGSEFRAMRWVEPGKVAYKD